MRLPNNYIFKNGRYRIIRFISAGGFGCTYEAEHILLKKRVAIKEFFINDFCNRDHTTHEVYVGAESRQPLVDKLRGKFIREAQSLSGMSHHGIVSVHDVFEENGTAYYVMDFIEGETIADLLKKHGPMPQSIAVRYISQVCEALRYVHSKGIMHLDLKPGNIMIDRDGNAILIDFGTSKQYDMESGENTSSLLGLTPGYAPPEQMRHKVMNFTPATDIYAIGATLYKMLTGNTPTDSMARASGDKLDPLPNAISANTRHAIDEAMRLNRVERPQSVDEFLKLLKGKPESVPHSTSKKKWLIPSLIAGGLALCMIIAILVIEKTKADPVPEITEVTVEADTVPQINGHEYVDLGLSVKWATENLVANDKSYFAWGETDPESGTSRWQGVSYNVLRNEEVIDSDGNLTPKHDAATFNWGAPWRMPTESEIKALCESCTWIPATVGGKNGYKVTASNGNSIFLPYGGYYYNGEVKNLGSLGFYWSATVSSDVSSADELYFDPNCHHLFSTNRYNCLQIRPVAE